LSRVCNIFWECYNKKKVSNEDAENININLSSLEESEIEPKKDNKAYIDAIKAYIG